MKAPYRALCCLLALAATAEAAHAGVEYIEYNGTASTRRGFDFLYGEHHILAYEDGRLSARTVLYTCASGAPFARKILSYAQAAAAAAAPDFFLDDASNGMQEGVRAEGAARYVFFRATGVDAEKSAPLPQAPELVVDAGFDAFIQAHWSELVGGSSVPLHFLVPSRLQAMRFVVQHLRADRFDGRPAEVFRMNLSGILGWFFSGIDVTYDAADHRLVRYEGLSDLRDASGDNFQASIVFHTSQRQSSSAQAMAAAQAAPLAPCHRG